MDRGLGNDFGDARRIGEGRRTLGGHTGPRGRQFSSGRGNFGAGLDVDESVRVDHRCIGGACLVGEPTAFVILPILEDARCAFIFFLDGFYLPVYPLGAQLLFSDHFSRLMLPNAFYRFGEDF